VLGTGSRPERGSRVTIRYREALTEEPDTSSVSQEQELEFNVGESEVIQALDLVVPLMNIGEEALVQVRSSYSGSSVPILAGFELCSSKPARLYTF
jgi:FKBP-type peptidyl-prolyl cis-trans isomerase